MSTNHYDDARRALRDALSTLDGPKAQAASTNDPIGFAQAAATAGLGKAILASLENDAEKLKAQRP